MKIIAAMGGHHLCFGPKACLWTLITCTAADNLLVVSTAASAEEEVQTCSCPGVDVCRSNNQSLDDVSTVPHPLCHYGTYAYDIAEPTPPESAGHHHCSEQ